MEAEVLKMRKEKGYGRRRIAWFLLRENNIEISENTITHILRRAGLARKEKQRKVLPTLSSSPWGRAPKGRKGYQGRVERSHRTDDEEFYPNFPEQFALLSPIILDDVSSFRQIRVVTIYWHHTKQITTLFNTVLYSPSGTSGHADRPCNLFAPFRRNPLLPNKILCLILPSLRRHSFSPSAEGA